MSVPLRYRHTGLVMVRASTDPGDLELPTCLDLRDPASFQQEGRTWLAKVWARGEVREALQMASPDLAVRVDALLDAAVPPAGDVRRAVMATVSYLLRWQRRSTPFGLFAGITTAAVGPARADIGARHRAHARVNADWITHLAEEMERHRGLRPRLMVIADSFGIARDGRFVVPARAHGDARHPGPIREMSIRLTRPVQAALAAAATPIRFDRLATDLTACLPGASPEKILALLHTLVDQHILITNLRPPMTAADPLHHLIGVLREAGGADLADLARLLRHLEHVRDLLARHNTAAPERAAALRAAARVQMAALAPGAGLATDMALDARIAVPDVVLQEAARAATVLLRLATEPFGRTAWMDYHARFLARYGPGALVPVKELVADSGLGYPGGYLGAPRARPTWRTIIDRDATLLALIQQAAQSGADEITLTDADVTALTVGDHDTVVLPHRIEIGVAVSAPSTEAINRGEFGLRITANPRAHTSMTGRFAHLLNDGDRARLAGSHAAGADAVVVQLSFPPRRPRNENLARVPPLLPTVVHLGEHPAGGGAIGVEDLAVTADSTHLHLVQRSTGRRVIARLPHALDTTVQIPPLARFLAEVADARAAAYKPFNYGAARTLPHLPRIRYRRTVLAPARWLLTTADVPGPSHGWDAALSAWRSRWRTPARVLLCHEDLRLPLDLDQPMDRAVLQTRLERAGKVELQEDDPAHGRGWIGRPAELLIPMTVVSPSRRSLPVMAAPGATTLVCAHLVGNPARFDDILARHLPPLADELADLLTSWWVRRHRDMIQPDADQYLAVYLRLADPGRYGPVAARLAAFAARLDTLGLPAQLAITTCREQPGRYGQAAALTAAEQAFTADTQAAITQIRVADAARLPGQALAAASMAHLAAAFAPGPVAGWRALVGCLERQTGPLDRTLRDHALRWGDPAHDYRTVRAIPGGETVAAAWRARDTALTAYHRALAGQRDPATVLRTLLHDHHVRALGVDPEYEKTTGRLARAAALRCLALAGAL
ncbi:lantibiotic dehydratase [Nonomuraea candida]|uniref:lantibiotic dehydratase n=1 Tax=Nonomuraea candida TaxID=359159 RepID=UPI0005BD15DE|nr:lantibiotic dehydratase [Nonomuraea candida]